MDNTHLLIKKIKEYAKENEVPIMMEEGIDFLTTYIIKHQKRNILEIGTAIGYSAIMMALVNPNVKVTTIEKDRERYLEAIKNIKKFNLEDRITLIFNDACDANLTGEYDLLFIDAAKGKNREFFEKFEKLLTEDGDIITDNINFHGYTAMELEEINNKNLRSLVKKIKLYVEFLNNNERYKTTFYQLGDGIAVSNRLK